ncbi:hypothetical protein LJB83_02765, partial [Clostridia bacterium OttesenSCG-928-F22]|nr:hypothetical protein [Clostridia bacterium OttesenSCG-928-F22]
MEKRYYSTNKPYAKHKKKRWGTKLLVKVVSFFAPTHTIHYKQKPADGEPVVYACNHDRAYGPLFVVLTFKQRFRPWVIDEVCHIKSAAKFARADFWQPKNIIGKIGSYLASMILKIPLPLIMRGLEAIPVFYDNRVTQTFTKSIQTLKEGIDIVIFPEERIPFSEINEEFQEGFVSIAKIYYDQTGKRLNFYPTYICKHNRTIQVGAPVEFNPDVPFREHQTQI